MAIGKTRWRGGGGLAPECGNFCLLFSSHGGPIQEAWGERERAKFKPKSASCPAGRSHGRCYTTYGVLLLLLARPGVDGFMRPAQADSHTSVCTSSPVCYLYSIYARRAASSPGPEAAQSLASAQYRPPLPSHFSSSTGSGHTHTHTHTGPAEVSSGLSQNRRGIEANRLQVLVR